MFRYGFNGSIDIRFGIKTISFSGNGNKTFPYTKAKIIDMYGFQISYEKHKIDKKERIKERKIQQKKNNIL